MKSHSPKETKNDGFFRSRLTQIINTQHELAQLAGKIDCESFKEVELKG